MVWSYRAELYFQTERRSPNQKFYAYSFALDTAKAATEALEAVCRPYNGEAPDATFTCAGAARPGFFVEMTEEDLANGMTSGYWIQAWTAWVSRIRCDSPQVLTWDEGSLKDDGETREERENHFCFFNPRSHVFCGIFFVLAREARTEG